MASYREVVLFPPIEPVRRCAKVPAVAHVLLAIDIPEPVENHGVEELAMTQSIPLSALGQEIGALVMLSIPPATTSSASPTLIA